MPQDAAGAIARMDFVLGRYMCLHGIYRVQVLVQDVTFEEDGSAVYIRRSVEKNDQTGKAAALIKLASNVANPHLCPVRLTKDYMKLLPPGSSPISRLLRNPNPSKSKLTQQPLGKNGPLRYVRYAAGFAGITGSDLKLYGTNSWRKAAANYIAKQAGDAMMEAVRKGTFHKTVAATKPYLAPASLSMLAQVSAQVLAEASQPSTSTPKDSSTSTAPAAPLIPQVVAQSSDKVQAPPTVGALPAVFPSAGLVISGNSNTTINITVSYAQESQKGL
jgi:hypothetical protein